MNRSAVSFDRKRETERITSFVARTVDAASAGGAVVALSGGIDSAVVGALCVRALGKTRVTALLMPSDHTPARDTSDARSLARGWGVTFHEIPISRMVGEIVGHSKAKGTRIANGNVEARVRMTLAYYHANTLGYLVAGTGDRSEALLGYFTKWGDGGADLLPIAHLFKTQVRQLGAYLGLPKGVVFKPASPQLWPGHRASDEIPADYDKLDIVLRCLYDLKMKPEGAAREAGVTTSVVDRVLAMHGASEHKRRVPPSLA